MHTTQYAEAAKKVSAKKPKENYLVIDLSYDLKVLLPYKDGVAFMASLANAERLCTPYGGPQRITELDRDCGIKSYLMSAEEYERFKIAALLNISPEDVKKYSQAQPEPTA